MLYESFVYFIPRGSSPDHPAIAGFGYDEDYLRNKFFPTVLQQVMPVTSQNDHLHPQLAMTVRKAKEETPLAASICWDGGVPEVERSFTGVFPMLILGIRPHRDHGCGHQSSHHAARLHGPGRTFSVDWCRDDLRLSKCIERTGAGEIEI